MGGPQKMGIKAKAISTIEKTTLDAKGTAFGLKIL
jgi:hypothetical protein